MIQLDQENADRDITSLTTVLTHTPDASNPRLCIALVEFGDGTKDLDGNGGAFSLQVEIGSQVVQPAPQSVTFGTAVRAAAYTFVFPVPANTAVVIKAKSPNAGDSDVDVTATLFDAVFNPIAQEMESGVTYKQGLQRIGATTAGKVSGAGSGTETFVGMDGSTDRVEATVDSIGNRTAISYDP